MQVQTSTTSAARPQPVRYLKRLSARYAGDESKARRVKRLMLHWRAQFDDARRARLFEDQIIRTCELRDLADLARTTAPRGLSYDDLSPIWRLEAQAKQAEAELRRLAVPGILDAIGADASGYALLTALGLTPEAKPASDLSPTD